MTDPKLVELRKHLNGIQTATDAHPDVFYNLVRILSILEDNEIIEHQSPMMVLANWAYVQLAIQLGDQLPPKLEE